MLEANLRIIQELKLFLQLIVSDSDLLSFFGNTPTAFTRRRKLTFDRMVLLIARLCKKTLSVELASFFNEIGTSLDCSTSAFCQQRMKLNPLFFKIWNKLLCDAFYAYNAANVKKWRTYRVVAIDGSNMSLVNTPSLSSHFGGQHNQHGSFVQAKAVYLHDVLNCLTISTSLVPFRTGEQIVAYSMIEQLEEDMLAIYDRNFCNYKMFALHLWQETERKFIIRAKESYEPFKGFIASGKKSDIVQLLPSFSAIKGLRQHGYIITRQTALKVRLVRVDLPDTVEVLVTNLWEEEDNPSHIFKELYFLRWKLETNISHQKNILQLESFSGLSPLSVAQDFYATVFTSNLHAILVAPAQKEVDEKPYRGKYPRKVNGNKSYGGLKTKMVKLFIVQNPESILLELQRYFVRNTLPIRSGRSSPRQIKNRNSKSKHKTYMNYKPAF
ncbi:IS4 family transposase [Flavihumibacter rivuli]|uniref:IS4 family transposase n=1 Tax=Flavihumibacter rivuli TaxID=2838156 RepID=UPI001BDE2797|nr:IS4 family transposase [Flavihumibacter rivuli]ULQ56422.1 IS4 family transposase [Flavihumibacter rivuli]ULQ57333.1 IS4 family transposase [Flavihumibacter rivuli]